MLSVTCSESLCVKYLRIPDVYCMTGGARSSLTFVMLNTARVLAIEMKSESSARDCPGHRLLRGNEKLKQVRIGIRHDDTPSIAECERARIGIQTFLGRMVQVSFGKELMWRWVKAGIVQDSPELNRMSSVLLSRMHNAPTRYSVSRVFRRVCKNHYIHLPALSDERQPEVQLG